MSVSSGSDVTIPIQDSPPPPPSPYGNRKLGSEKAAVDRVVTPEPRGDIVTVSGGLENEAYQAEATCLNNENAAVPKKSHTEIPMNDYSNGTVDMSSTKMGSHLNEAVNSELVNMNVLDTIPHKPQPEFGPYENFDDYFISVNQHKKFLRRGEKLYVTKDKRKSIKWKKYVCWSFAVFLVTAIVAVAVLAGVGYFPQKTGTGSFNSMIGMTTTTGLPDLSSSDNYEEYSSSSSTVNSATDESQSTTTGPIIPMPDIYVPSAAELQLVLENGEYEPELANSSSIEFRTLSAELQEEVKSLLETEGNAGTAYARVTSFSSGSIIANLRIGWVTELGETREYSEIQKLVSSWRQIGNYQLRHGTTTIYRMYNFCKTNNGGCSDSCAFEYETLDIVCACPESKLLGEDKKSCQEMPLPVPSSTEETVTEPPVHISPEPTEASPIPVSSESPVEEIPVVSSAAPEVEAEPVTTTTTTTTTTSTTTSTTTAPPPETTATTTTTTSEAPEPSPVDGSISSHEAGRSIEPVETTQIPEEAAGSTDLPHPPVEDYNPGPIQVYPVDQPLSDISTTTTTTTTTTTMPPALDIEAEPEIRPVETASQETVLLPVETVVEAEAEPEVPVETTIAPPVQLQEVEVPVATTTTTTTTAAPVHVHQQESGSYEDGSNASNSQSLESETIVAATTTPTTTTTSSTTTTPAPPAVSEEQIDSRSIETESEEANIPGTNLTSQSRKTGRAFVEPAVVVESETEAPVTGTPFPIPTRPPSTSDEFMAYSDANMKEINARLTNRTTTSTAAPETHHADAGSYENVSGVGELEISSGSHSEEGGASVEERRTGSLLLSPPEVIPINSLDVNSTTTTTTPSSRERETLETVEDQAESIGASQEHEVTTIQPISLHNDTAVNDLTPGITEDSLNTDSVLPNKDVVFDEVHEESQHSVPSVPETTVTPAISVEIQADSVESVEPVSSEVSGERTTTTSTTTPAPIQVPTSAHPTIFSTTLKILPNVGSNVTAEAAEPSFVQGSSSIETESSEHVNPSQTQTIDNEI